MYHVSKTLANKSQTSCVLGPKGGDKPVRATGGHGHDHTAPSPPITTSRVVGNLVTGTVSQESQPFFN